MSNTRYDVPNESESVLSGLSLTNDSMYISSGGTALDTTVDDYSKMYVCDGGMAIDTIIKTAYLYVSSGGSALQTSLAGYDASLHVYSGGVADGVSGTGNYNAVVADNGGTVKNVVLDNYGHAYVSSGGVISGLELKNAHASCYGEISGLVMNYSGAWLDVCDGGKLTDAVVNGGELRVTSSASAIGVTVNAGFLGVTYDANLNSATIHSGASMNVGGGINATASNVVVSGGQLNLYSGGAIDKLEVMDNIDPETWSGTVGKVTAYGGTLDHTSVTGYGSVTLSSGAVANNTVLNRTDELRSTYGGEFYVYNGAVANNTVIGENYNMRIWVGGSASGVTVLSGGWADLGSNGGAFVTGVEVSSGGVCRVSSGTTATDLVIRKGGTTILYVVPGTDVQGTCDGSTFHLQNGVLSDFTVLDGGIAPIVYSGGTLTNVAAVRDGGNFCVSTGGTILGTVSVEQGGSMFCYGGTVEKVVENGGWVDAHPYYGTDITFAENTFTGVKLSSGMSATVHSGTTANSTLVEGIYSSGAGASLRIYDGGIASNTEAIHCGYLEVSSGGTAVNTLIHSSASIRLEESGTAIGTTIKDGARLFTSVYSSGTAFVSDTVISSAGTLYLTPYSGCVSACNTVVESGGTLYLAPAGSSYPHVVLSGTTIKSGAVIERISSSYYPIGRVSAFDTVLESGVTLTPYEQDYYSRTTLKENAVFEIGSGVYVDTVDATGAGATVRILSSGEVESALIGSGASMTLAPGAEAMGVVIDGGTMRVTGSGPHDDFLFDTGVFVTIVQNGTVTVESGAYLHIVSAGAGGRVEVGSGAAVLEMVQLTDGGEMHVAEGGQVYFLLDQQKAPSMHIQVNDLSGITGAPDYRLAVKSNQTRGTYVFASGAADFNDTITVVDGDLQELGKLKLNETVKIGDNNYTLRQANGNLGVTITDVTGIEVSRGDIDNSGISDVLFQWTGGGYQLGYWMNGRSVEDGVPTWKCTGMTHSKDWEVLGNYVMDGDGNADTVLFGNVQPEGGFKGAYVGYYRDGVDLDENWVTIGYLTNEDDIDWKNKVGNLTGNADANSILWYAPELYALGVWKDGKEDWQSISSSFGGDDWTLAGCGDFDGDGRDSVVMSYANGLGFYSVEIDGAVTSMGGANWAGWEIRAIGDFSGDRKDDMVLFHKETGSMVLLADGNLDSYTSIGQLDPEDWFVVGAGDYNGDQKDDLLVRQYSTGTLGYYVCAEQSKWTELGDGVGMEWTVIA